MKVPEEDEEEDLGTETKVLYAPTQFYDACDECDTLPEDRWEEFRHKLEEEKKMIIEGRERVIDQGLNSISKLNSFLGINNRETKFNWFVYCR